MKDLSFRIRVDEGDRRRLRDLAAHYEMPAAAVVRMLLKEKHAEIAPPPAPPQARDERQASFWE